jgi:hypothetical protein
MTSPISKSGSSGAPTVSIVVPIYDEELVIEALHSRLQRFAGATKYPFRRMLALALDAVFALSKTPLRLATWFGLVAGRSTGF